jgi:hypothetical protein
MPKSGKYFKGAKAEDGTEKLGLFGNFRESPQHLVVNSISRRNHGFGGLKRIKIRENPF